MKHSDGWETPDSDTIKKEVISRISNYEDEVKKLLLTDQATRVEMAVALKRLKEREQQLHAANIELKKLEKRLRIRKKRSF
jgi:hypothetical protein